jgi:hypothetical protein
MPFVGTPSGGGHLLGTLIEGQLCCDTRLCRLLDTSRHRGHTGTDCQQSSCSDRMGYSRSKLCTRVPRSPRPCRKTKVLCADRRCSSVEQLPRLLRFGESATRGETRGRSGSAGTPWRKAYHRALRAGIKRRNKWSLYLVIQRTERVVEVRLAVDGHVRRH